MDIFLYKSDLVASQVDAKPEELHAFSFKHPVLVIQRANKVTYVDEDKKEYVLKDKKKEE